MAVYKVPQDVEAEDKLVGPFGFRQFVYLAIAGAAGFIGYLLLRISPFLIIIPLPIMAFFIILALPLRKEQPMETYLLALLRFFLKSKLRRWNPDGTITYVEIIAPKLIEPNLSKEYGADAATQRIDYLARIMDSRGWALKGGEPPGASIKDEITAEAQTATDVLDESAALAQSFTAKMAQKDEEHRQQVAATMQQVAQQQASAPPPADNSNLGIAAPRFNPYPTSMHQRVVTPIGEGPTTAPIATPAKSNSAVPQKVSPDIIRLANNDDLSISAIANEAHRLENEGEVIINLH